MLCASSHVHACRLSSPCKLLVSSICSAMLVVQANPVVLCLPVLQARGFNEVFQLLRTVPRLNRATGSHSALMCSGGLFTDNIIRFDNERTQWEARCVVQLCSCENSTAAKLCEGMPARPRMTARTQWGHARPRVTLHIQLQARLFTGHLLMAWAYACLGQSACGATLDICHMHGIGLSWWVQ